MFKNTCDVPRNVNSDVMEMLIFAYACKMACACKIVGVMPYMPYSKQSKMRKRGCIAAKLLAQMMTNAGACRRVLSDVTWLT